MNFLSQCTLEVTPGGAKKIRNFAEILEPETTVFVTFLAGSDFADTTKTVVRLKQEGMNPVPHFAARSTASKSGLEESLNVLQAETGIDEVLVVAGGNDHPVGDFDSTMQLLETGLFEKYGIGKIGVAGHPEGSSDIPPEEINRALREKNTYARTHDIEMYIVTQFCFEAAPIIEWDRRIREQGNKLPIHIGIPGLATIKSLIGHSKACGIGPSMRVLTRQAGNIAKLMTTSAPDRLVRDLAVYAAIDKNCGIKKCHLYPLGGLQKSAAWLYSVQEGNFELDSGNGFRVIQSAHKKVANQ